MKSRKMCVKYLLFCQPAGEDSRQPSLCCLKLAELPESTPGHLAGVFLLDTFLLPLGVLLRQAPARE